MKAVKILMVENKISQKKLASEIGLSQQTFNNYVNDKTQPDIATIIKLADYFKTTTDNILGHEVPYLLDKSTLSQEQQELLEAIKNLSPANCKRVKDFITGVLIAEEEKQQLINLYRKGGN